MLTKQFGDVLPTFGYVRVPEAAMPKLVYCGVKLAQVPFFFQLSGGLAGQHGQQYMTSRVKAVYLDHAPQTATRPLITGPILAIVAPLSTGSH
jgi:hypothetical protein